MTTEEEENMTTEEEENMTTEEESLSTAEEGYSVQRDFWRQAAESDGFDLENVKRPPGMNGVVIGLIPYDCQLYKRYPYRILVDLFAKVGLHRYNLFKGTSFELATLMKFNMLQNYMSSFYMTLLAHDPDPAASSLQKTFQVRVDEQDYGTLHITCSIARIKAEVSTETPFIPHFQGGARAYGIFKGELPDWPSDDALNDGKRFYVVKESEWQSTDWISMYLELVITTTDRSITETRQKTEVLSQLEIVKVAIETANEDVEPPNERLKAKSAHVYITFKGLAEPRAPRRVFEIGEHVERQAIVRRVMNHTGYLTLKGKLCGGQYIKKRSLALKSGEESQDCKKQACVG
ncbi:Protein MS5 [Arabidopsis thaliana x Arabidopsis arenosa]|uniref:Protein MS5 n=1 Tax=Arabidopsis thaliana x Arabidopsis arenosa TaxID=1240361 RepID=A0A8T2CBP1_9BRAS|nr:Protein MS5 [Arabidopsis thaliana x Arabidopsis arenosa]